jgi:hypothetical protein
LHLPDVSGVVSAFGAFDSNGWEGSEFLFFLAYYGYKLLWAMLNHFGNFGFDFLG